MKIIETVPVILAPERPQEGVVYLENDPEHQTLASKIALLKDYDFDYAIFRHSDLRIDTPKLVEPQCELMRVNNVGVAGLIGTLYMSEACAWWMHNRGVVTVGAIMQGDGKGGAYPMLDGPGFRADAVSVDGCFMIFSKHFVDKYEVHNFGSWRYGYDMDACFQCLRMGMNVGIADIRCTHDSQGKMTPDFEQVRQNILAYWKQHVDFPVIKQSEFKK